MEALYIYLHFYILPYLCTFWHAIPTSYFICNVFFFIFIIVWITYVGMVYSAYHKRLMYNSCGNAWVTNSSLLTLKPRRVCLL